MYETVSFSSFSIIKYPVSSFSQSSRPVHLLVSAWGRCTSSRAQGGRDSSLAAHTLSQQEVKKPLRKGPRNTNAQHKEKDEPMVLDLDL